MTEETYIALLRAVNVSGHNVIKMAALRSQFEGLGLRSVRTYIQSGNVLFTAGGEPTGVLRARIEAQIRTAFGLEVPVVLRTAGELRQVLDNCPFTPAEFAEGNVGVTLLTVEPDPEQTGRLQVPTGVVDTFRLVGREIYILYRQASHLSKLSNQFFEQRLRVPATQRNWRTLQALSELAQGQV